VSDGSATRTVVVNGERRTVRASNLEDLVVELGLDPRLVAIEHQGEVVSRSRHGETPLEDGDKVEIVRFVQGGRRGREGPRAPFHSGSE
jgi:thiamine biosynthesis protein ThiS